MTKTSMIVGVSVLALVVGLTSLTRYKTAKQTENKTEKVVINNPTVTDEQLGGYPTTNTLVNKKDILKVNVIDKSRVLYFVDDFNFHSVRSTVEKLKELESKSNSPIWLLIDSPGGSVIDGATLISQIEASKAPVYTVCTRLCASMAAFLHSYGHKRYMLDRAILMYHPASASASGQLPNMLSLLKTVQRIIDKMNSNIYTRAKIEKSEFEKLIAYELWIDAEDATNKGLNDGIVNLNIPNVPSNQSSSQLEEKRNSNKKFPTTVQFNL